MAMATGIQKLSGCDITLAITGIAGPDGGSEEKPVGTAYIAIQLPGQDIITHILAVNPSYCRERIKYWFSQYALFYLLKALSYTNCIN